MSISGLSSTAVHSLPAGRTFSPLPLIKLDSREFLQRFKQGDLTGERVATDEISCINNTQRWIASISMDDCIALFAIHREGDAIISNILCYHISSGAKLDDMLETLKEDPGYDPDKEHDLYLIGGNAASTAPGDLLDSIREALPTLFPRSPLKEVYTNLKAEGYYIAVAIEIDGDSFLFCDYPISSTS